MSKIKCHDSSLYSNRFTLRILEQRAKIGKLWTKILQIMHSYFVHYAYTTRVVLMLLSASHSPCDRLTIFIVTQIYCNTRWMCWVELKERKVKRTQATLRIGTSQSVDQKE